MKDKQSGSDKVNNLKNYHTKQKSQIRDIFINHPNDNFTVDKLMILLTKNKTPVSKATLYRNLEFMIDNGEDVYKRQIYNTYRHYGSFNWC